MEFEAFLTKTCTSIGNCETQAIVSNSCNFKNTNCCVGTVATKKWKRKRPLESEDMFDLD